MQERIMLIVWKWRNFERSKNVVSLELLEELDFQPDKNFIGRAENTLFDRYTVCDQRPDGSTPAVDPPATIVRTYIETHTGHLNNTCFQYLAQLVQYLKKGDNQLYVFLHRRDGFGDGEVRALLRDHPVDKCFLIGGSRDFIYRNLLSDDGRFFTKTPEKDRPEVKVADNKAKIVYQLYFDKVWEYYRHEFYTKIFELKEDLLSHFYTIRPADQVWTYEQMREHMNTDRPLYLRVHSFMDDQCRCLTDAEKEELNVFGKQDGKSYEFDDCYVNLAQNKALEKEYTTVSDLLNQLFQEDPVLANGKSINDWLQAIEQAFSTLLNALRQHQNNQP